MAKTYVTLVSEQAIPNVQYIKEFSAEIDTYLFISTPKMEEKKRTQSIIDACQLPTAKYHVEIVNEESLINILAGIDKAIKKPIFATTQGFIVNCTLGTKIMSIALYEYFKNKADAVLYYSPIGTNKYKSVLDDTFEQQFSSEITVEEYLRSYGIEIEGVGKPCFPNDHYPNKFFKLYLGFNYRDFNVLTNLREGRSQKYLRDGIADLTEVNGLSAFLAKINFPSRTSLTADEAKFLTGGWFEEWTYYLILNHLGLKKGEIVLGLKTFIDAENELDVTFIFKNDIYIIECKTGMPDKDLQQKTLYKSGALIDKFGKSAHSFLFTLSNLRDKTTNEIKDSIKLRALQQKVTVADRPLLTSDLLDFLKANFKK